VVVPPSDAGTVANNKPLGIIDIVKTEETGGKGVNGKPEQESGSVKNTPINSEPVSVVTNMGGVVNADGKAIVGGGEAGNVGTINMNPLVNSDVSGDAQVSNEARLLDI